MNDRALMFGWHARNFHYIKNLKSLGEYMKPVKSDAEKLVDGNRKALAMMRRLARKGRGDGAR